MDEKMSEEMIEDLNEIEEFQKYDQKSHRANRRRMAKAHPRNPYRKVLKLVEKRKNIIKKRGGRNFKEKGVTFSSAKAQAIFDLT